VRRTVPLLFTLLLAPTVFAEPAEKPLGRTLDQRFGKLDQGLVFDPRQGAIGEGRGFQAGNAQTKSFQFNQSYNPGKYETREFTPKKSSWLSKLNFFAKAAPTEGTHEVPNLGRQAETKTAAVKEARDADKIAATRDLPDGNRPYLGPESKKLDRSVDPAKPLPGWAGDRMETLTLGQVRELLNKNK
jgi:hypothetical protein